MGLLLLLLVIFQTSICVHQSAEGRSSSGRGRGFTAEIVHKDHPGSPSYPGENFTVSQKVHRDSLHDITRVRALSNRQMENYFGARQERSLRDIQTGITSIQPGYIMKIKLGTPEQTFVALADTGSDLVWVQCDPCTSCFTQVDRVFSPSASSSYQKLACASSPCQDLKLYNNLLGCSPSCQYNYSYGDNSNTQGDLSAENLTLSTTDGGVVTFPGFAFGCGHNNEATVQKLADGIVGLGRGALSFPSQLSSGLAITPKFSYCLTSRYKNPSATNTIVFGDSAVVPGKTFLYTPLVNSSVTGIDSLYYVTLQGISVGDNRLTISSSVFDHDPNGTGGGVIFDSGTTFTHLVPTAYNALLSALQQALSFYSSAEVDVSSQTGLDLCYLLEKNTVFSPPNITLHLLNADYEMTFDNIFVDVSTNSKFQIFCLTIQSSSDANINIIGNAQQIDFQVLYDNQNSQLGFVHAECTSDGSSRARSLLLATASSLAVLVLILIA